MTPETLFRRMILGCVVLMLAGALAGTLYAAYGPRDLNLVASVPAPAPPALSMPAEWIIEASDRYGVPWRASMALADGESGLQPDAVGCGGGCFGVMQLNGQFFVGARSMSVQENVDNGVRYFKAMILWCEELSDTPGPDGGVQFAHFNGDGVIAWNQTTKKLSGCAVDRYKGKKR